MYETTGTESFDERRAREMRDREAAQTRHVERCVRVVGALGESWWCESPEDRAPYQPRASLAGPGGARIDLDVSEHGAHKGRIAASGRFAPDTRQWRRHDAPKHEITVAGDAAPERIAAELRRRLLPEYLAELAQCCAARDRATTRHAAEVEAARALALAVPGGELSDDGTKSPGLAWFDAGCSATFHAEDDGAVSVRLSVSAGFSAADAAAILRLVFAAHHGH